MEKEKYINRQPNFKPDDVKRWNDSENNITAIPIELAERMQNTFNELAKANSKENNSNNGLVEGEYYETK